MPSFAFQLMQAFFPQSVDMLRVLRRCCLRRNWVSYDCGSKVGSDGNFRLKIRSVLHQFDSSRCRISRHNNHLVTLCSHHFFHNIVLHTLHIIEWILHDGRNTRKNVRLSYRIDSFGDRRGRFALLREESQANVPVVG